MPTLPPYTMPEADHLRANVPVELQQIDQWVTWTIKENRKKNGEIKYDKIPRNPHNGAFASSTDPATWSTFDHAIEAAEYYSHNGIGFVLAEGTPVVGIDLDDCIDGSTQLDGATMPHNLQSWAYDIVEGLISYTEYSPSGKGIRIFVLGVKTVAECRKNNIEVYNWGRFLTVTGNQVPGTPDHVMARQEALEAFFISTFGAHTTALSTPSAPSTPSTNGHGPSTGKHAGNLITTPFILNPEAEPPFKKWQLLCRLQPLVGHIFNHVPTAVAKYANNRSRIEQALANYAIGSGWTDQEAVNLLIAHSVQHGEEVKHLRYYQHTITSAHDTRTHHRALEALIVPNGGNDTGPHTTGPPRPPRLQVAPADEELSAGFFTPEAAEPGTVEDDLLLGEEGLISQALGLVVTNIVKYDSQPPSYRMLTNRGDVYLPSVTKLIHQGFLREALAMVGHYLKPIDKNEWPIIAQRMLDACAVVEVGDDSRETGAVLVWLQLYFAERRIKEKFEDAVASKFPYMEHNKLHIFGPDLQSFIKVTLKEQLNPVIFGAKMRSFGAEPLQVAYQKPSGHRTTHSVWRLPEWYRP